MANPFDDDEDVGSQSEGGDSAEAALIGARGGQSEPDEAAVHPSAATRLAPAPPQGEDDSASTAVGDSGSSGGSIAGGSGSESDRAADGGGGVVQVAAKGEGASEGTADKGSAAPGAGGQDSDAHTAGTGSGAGSVAAPPAGGPARSTSPSSSNGARGNWSVVDSDPGALAAGAAQWTGTLPIGAPAAAALPYDASVTWFVQRFAPSVAAFLDAARERYEDADHSRTGGSGMVGGAGAADDARVRAALGGARMSREAVSVAKAAVALGLRACGDAAGSASDVDEAELARRRAFLHVVMELEPVADAFTRFVREGLAAVVVPSPSRARHARGEAGIRLSESNSSLATVSMTPERSRAGVGDGHSGGGGGGGSAAADPRRALLESASDDSLRVVELDHGRTPGTGVEISVPHARPGPASPGSGHTVVWYYIETSLPGMGRSECSRRYSHFSRLHSELSQWLSGPLGAAARRSGAVLPPLPPKTWLGGGTDQAFVETRRRELQAFLRALVAVQALLFHPEVSEFLHLPADAAEHAASQSGRPDVWDEAGAALEGGAHAEPYDGGAAAGPDKSHEVRFDAGPLGLRFAASGDANYPAVVLAFPRMPGGAMGPAEAGGLVSRGDAVWKVNGRVLPPCSYEEAVGAIRNAQRPLTIEFRTPPRAGEVLSALDEVNRAVMGGAPPPHPSGFVADRSRRPEARSSAPRAPARRPSPVGRMPTGLSTSSGASSARPPPGARPAGGVAGAGNPFLDDFDGPGASASPLDGGGGGGGGSRTGGAFSRRLSGEDEGGWVGAAPRKGVPAAAPPSNWDGFL